MNERIKELYKQSRDFYYEDEYLDYSEKERTQKIQTMFAELIVRECGVALSPMLRDQISRGKAFDLIKQHFGVEE